MFVFTLRNLGNIAIIWVFTRDSILEASKGIVIIVGQSSGISFVKTKNLLIVKSRNVV